MTEDTNFKNWSQPKKYVQALADAQNVTALQTQDSKFRPWWCGAEHATSQSRRLPTLLNHYEWAGKKHFVPLKLEGHSGARTPDLLALQAGSFKHGTGAPALQVMWFPLKYLSLLCYANGFHLSEVGQCSGQRRRRWTNILLARHHRPYFFLGCRPCIGMTFAVKHPHLQNWSRVNPELRRSPFVLSWPKITLWQRNSLLHKVWPCY